MNRLRRVGLARPNDAPVWKWPSVWREARRRSVLWARRYARRPEDAEDIAQEALLRAWRHRAAIKDPERFFGWLSTIVRNEAARRYRKAEGELLGDVGGDVPDESDWMAAATSRADVGRGLERLAEHERTLLRLRYEDDLTQSEIAARLSLPEGTVKVQLHRARAKLRRALE